MISIYFLSNKDRFYRFIWSVSQFFPFNKCKLVANPPWWGICGAQTRTTSVSLKSELHQTRNLSVINNTGLKCSSSLRWFNRENAKASQGCAAPDFERHILFFGGWTVWKCGDHKRLKRAQNTLKLRRGLIGAEFDLARAVGRESSSVAGNLSTQEKIV